MPQGIIIIDAGEETVDLHAYHRKDDLHFLAFKEIAPAHCACLFDLSYCMDAH